MVVGHKNQGNGTISKVFVFFSELCEKAGIPGIPGFVFPNRKWDNSKVVFCFFSEVCEKAGIPGIPGIFFCLKAKWPDCFFLRSL